MLTRSKPRISSILARTDTTPLLTISLARSRFELETDVIHDMQNKALSSNSMGDAINRSIKQVDSKTWILGPLVLYRSESPSGSATWNDPEDGSSYTIIKSSPLLNSATTALDSPFIRLAHEGGTESAVWAIGNNAFCKVRYIDKGVTPESTTLKAVQVQRFSFDTPSVFYHGFGKGRSYLFVQRIPGITLQAAWPQLDEHWRIHYVNAVVNAYEEMAQWKRPSFGGVDGAGIPDRCLIKRDHPDNFDPAKLHTACKELGMDVKDFVFHHADMGPTNIIVEEQPSLGKIGIIDFEIAGFYPVLWIRTKVRIAAGLDLDTSDDPLVWRKEVQKALGARGFEDVAQAWNEWWNE